MFLMNAHAYEKLAHTHHIPVHLRELCKNEKKKKKKNADNADVKKDAQYNVGYFTSPIH